MKAILLFSSITLAALTAYADPSAAPDAKKQAEMNHWHEYATPGAPHKIFEDLRGNWTYTSKFWEPGSSKPMESSGTATFKTILGGRFLHYQVQGMAMGMPFEGLGALGYNNLNKVYESTWIDNMATGITSDTGTYDAKTHTLSTHGEASCPASPENKAKFRTTWKLGDKNKIVYTMWHAGIDGKEAKAMELIYKRAK